MKRILSFFLALMLAACLSPSGGLAPLVTFTSSPAAETLPLPTSTPLIPQRIEITAEAGSSVAGTAPVSGDKAIQLIKPMGLGYQAGILEFVDSAGVVHSVNSDYVWYYPEFGGVADLGGQGMYKWNEQAQVWQGMSSVESVGDTKLVNGETIYKVGEKYAIENGDRFDWATSVDVVGGVAIATLGDGTKLKWGANGEWVSAIPEYIANLTPKELVKTARSWDDEVLHAPITDAVALSNKLMEMYNAGEFGDLPKGKVYIPTLEGGEAGTDEYRLTGYSAWYAPDKTLGLNPGVVVMTDENGAAVFKVAPTFKRVQMEGGVEGVALFLEAEFLSDYSISHPSTSIQWIVDQVNNEFFRPMKLHRGIMKYDSNSKSRNVDGCAVVNDGGGVYPKCVKYYKEMYPSDALHEYGVTGIYRPADLGGRIIFYQKSYKAGQ